MAGLRHLGLAAFAVGALGAACAGCAHAGDDSPDDDSLLKKAAKMGGLATDAEPAKDFVVSSRPEASDYVPIFRPAFDTGTKAKTPAELKAMQADFSAVQARHDAARAAFPPAAKALAEKRAADAAKAKKKKPVEGVAPPQ